jgi:hypothetical protein
MNKAIHTLGHKLKRFKLNKSLPNTTASIPAQDKNRTCDRCLALWSKVPFYEHNEDICILEETTEELLGSNCQICQILGATMQACQEATPSLTRPLLRWHMAFEDLPVRRRLLWRDSEPFTINGVVMFHDSEGSGAYPQDKSRMMVSYPGPSSIADSWKSLATTGNGLIDFDMLKSWLNKCESHAQCGPSMQGGPRDLQVVDCTKRAVVLAPVNCQYVALSYVWGGMVLETDLTSELLPTLLPRTIEDSIKATLLLGYQYLWIEWVFLYWLLKKLS